MAEHTDKRTATQALEIHENIAGRRRTSSPSRHATPLRRSNPTLSAITWASPVASTTRSNPPTSSRSVASGTVAVET